MGDTMKRVMAILGCILMAAVVMARPKSQSVPVVLTGAAVYAGTSTTTRVNGYIDEIVVSCSDGSSTGIVAVSVSPAGGIDDVNIAIETLDQLSGRRPRVDSTTVAGADNTGDDPVQFIVVGETINVEVTASEASNVTWRCYIKYDDGK